MVIYKIMVFITINITLTKQNILDIPNISNTIIINSDKYTLI